MDERSRDSFRFKSKEEHMIGMHTLYTNMYCTMVSTTDEQDFVEIQNLEKVKKKENQN